MKMKSQKVYLATNLAIICTIQLFLSSSLSAYYELDDIDKEEYSKIYSSLPSPQENSEKLNTSPQFKPFLETAEEIVTRYGLESHVGLSLIHQHFPTGRDQVIVEEYQEIGTIPSLVTWAHTYEEAQDQFALPSSWMFINPQKDPVLFEASTDPEVKIGNQMLQKNPEFMEEMSKLLYSQGLNNLLAVSLLKRGSLVAGEDQVYTERLTIDERKSVVQLEYAKNQPSDAIRTSWSFKGPKQRGCVIIRDCIPLKDGGHHYFWYHEDIN